MKRQRLLSLLAGLALVLSCVTSSRAGTTNLLAYGNVTGTNNGTFFLVPNVYIPPQKFLFQNGGLTNLLTGTNSLTINIQISIDGGNSNWITLATYNPIITNTIVDVVTPNFNAISIPMRCQVITTNPVAVSTFVQQ